MKSTALLLAVLAGSLAVTAAEARPAHHRRFAQHRGHGQVTFPITAGSSDVRINAVGEVIPPPEK